MKDSVDRQMKLTAIHKILENSIYLEMDNVVLL